MFARLGQLYPYALAVATLSETQAAKQTQAGQAEAKTREGGRTHLSCEHVYRDRDYTRPEPRRWTDRRV